MARISLSEELLRLEPAARKAALARLNPRQRGALRTHWRLWAHEGQVPPPASWHTWLIMAGRGYGKTRAGAPNGFVKRPKRIRRRGLRWSAPHWVKRGG
jgi:hypothetical protein